MLSDNDLMQIQTAADRMIAPVTLLVNKGEAPDSFAENLLNTCRQITGVSMNRIRLEESRESALFGKPAITISSEGAGNIHYLAAPEGHEFTPFLDALIRIGGTEETADADIDKLPATLSTPVDLHVFITPICPHCPQTVRAAISLGICHNLIRVMIIDALQFPDLADRFKVKSTPTVIINEGFTFVGQVGAGELMDRIAESVTGGSLTRILDSMIESGRAEDAGLLICRERKAEALLPLYTAKEFSRKIGSLVALEAALEKDPHILDSIVPDLAALLKHDEAALRGDTAELLGKIGHPTAIPALKKALDDPDPEVREAVMEALELLED